MRAKVEVLRGEVGCLTHTTLTLDPNTVGIQEVKTLYSKGKAPYQAGKFEHEGQWYWITLDDLATLLAKVRSMH